MSIVHVLDLARRRRRLSRRRRRRHVPRNSSVVDIRSRPLRVSPMCVRRSTSGWCCRSRRSFRPWRRTTPVTVVISLRIHLCSFSVVLNSPCLCFHSSPVLFGRRSPIASRPNLTTRALRRSPDSSRRPSPTIGTMTRTHRFRYAIKCARRATEDKLPPKTKRI